MVAGPAEQVVQRVAVAVVLLQLAAQPLPETLVAVRGAPDRHDPERGRQQAVAQQVAERREQVAPGQVAGGTEQEQGVVHRATIPKVVGRNRGGSH